jgi:tetratricopeptide (TPR) repeat protein
MGFAFMDSKRYDSAIDAFSHALNLTLNSPVRGDEDGMRFRMALGEAYKSAGRIDEATTEYREVLREAPAESPYSWLARQELARPRAAASQKH